MFINPTDQRLFFPTEQGSIYCLDRATGEQIWRRDIGGPIETPLQFDGSQLFFGTTATDGPGTVLALNAVDGTPRWESALPTLTKSAPVLFGDSVIVRDQSGDVLAFDQETGDQQWDRTFETHSLGWSFQGPLVKNERVYTYGVDTTASQDNRLIALEATDGTTAWQREISAPVSMLASSPDHLFSVHRESLHAVAPRDGTIRWRRKLTGQSNVLSVNGAVYVTNANSVTVYDTEDGREVNQFKLDGLLQGYVPRGRGEESFVGRQRPVPGGLLGMTEEAIYALGGGQGGQDSLGLAGGFGVAGLCLYALHRWRDR
ncbi:outer membrane protein assembly factor BamB family protein [Halomicrobium zhouii]|uniref:outer membrane protein assembly factor BamB family protein n=1 Tax=Halomicrobium zhouii TaxID=767519 RepID=UPI001FE88BF9|nr:PQQ-binding-like beta-propeller repeat protein [Halomicrobium zhouii]